MSRARASVPWIGVILCFGASAACNAISGVGKFSFEGAGGGAGSPSSSSGTSTGSSTGGPACTEPSQCPAVPPGPCASLGTKTCTGGVCGVTYTAGDAPSQVYGDCHKNVCDTTGTMTTKEDDMDVFDSGNPCVPWTCVNGVPGPNVTSGAQCTLGIPPPVGACEPSPANPAVFVCSQCDHTIATSCLWKPTTVCSGGTCVASHCTNGVPDGGETDLNCGGSECLPCGTGKSCQSHSDCLSQVCTGGKCQAPSCSDGWQNGAESDVDCGGGTCPPCQDTKQCAQHSDCASGVCRPAGSNVPDRCAAPTCTDGVKNGGETGVDCGGDGDGGPVCPPCPM